MMLFSDRSHLIVDNRINKQGAVTPSLYKVE